MILVAVSLCLTACFGDGSSKDPEGGDGSGGVQSGGFDVTITFDTDGGTSMEPITATYGTSIEDMITPPTRDGYEFSHWRSEQMDYWDYFCRGDETVVAVWTPKEYNVSFTIEGFEELEEYFGGFTYLAGEPCNFWDGSDQTIVSIPKGYKFSGWYTDREFTNPISGITSDMYGDKEIFGKIEFYPYNFALNDDGTYAFSMQYFIEPPSISRFESDVASLTEVVIPSSYKGVPVTEIRTDAFAYNWENVESVIIPDTVTRIGNYAFSGTQITDIEIPDGIKHVGVDAFPDNIATVEYNGGYYLGNETNPHLVFYKAIDFDATEISIKDGTRAVAGGAFCVDPSEFVVKGMPITEIVIPDSVFSIGIAAFDGCYQLEKITMGPNVEPLDSSLFGDCAIKEISAPVAVIGSIPDVYSGSVTKITLTGGAEIDDNLLKDFTSLETLNMCDSIESISDNAFKYNTSLAAVGISTGIKNLKSLAFIDKVPVQKTLYNGAYYVGNAENPYFLLYAAESSAQTSANIHADTVFIWHNAFKNNNSLTMPAFPEGLIDIGDNAFSNSAMKNWSGTELDGGMYVGNARNPYLVLVGIATGATELEVNEKNCAYATDIFNNSSLRELILPKGMTEIPKNMFLNNTTIEKIVLPDGVTTIGDHAFQGCTALRELIIPDSVVNVGLNIVDFRVQHNPNNNTMQPVHQNVLHSDGEGFYLGNAQNPYHILFAIWSDSKSATNSYTAKDGTKVVAPNVMRSDMYEIVLPNSVKVISAYAFGNGNSTLYSTYCDSLVSIILGSSVEYIGDHAFDNCVNLKGTRNRNTDVIGGIVLPDSLTYLGASAFSSCKKLVGITIGAGLTEIKGDTFMLCESLTEIIIPSNIKSIGEWAFSFCTKIKTIRIARGVETIGKSAFTGNYGSDGNYLYDGHAYCGASSKPQGWHNDWIGSNITVHWGSN